MIAELNQEAIVSKESRPFQVLLVQAREAEIDLQHELRGFHDALGLSRHQIRPLNAVRQHIRPREATQFVAVIVAGSPLSVEHNLEGFNRLKHLLDHVRAKGIPLFGICFGAQFLARHFGGSVVINGGRSEHGTMVVRRTPGSNAHELFAELPESFDAQHSHHDHIAELPRDAHLLAENERCPIQAFSMDGGRTIGTQFHPERTPAWYDAVLAEAKSLPPHKVAHYRRMRAEMRPSPHANLLLRTFVQRAVKNAFGLLPPKSRHLACFFCLWFFMRVRRIHRYQYSRLRLRLH